MTGCSGLQVAAGSGGHWDRAHGARALVELVTRGASRCWLWSHGGFLPASWWDTALLAAGATVNALFAGAEVPPEGRCTWPPWPGLGQCPCHLCLPGQLRCQRVAKPCCQGFWLQKGLILLLDVSRSPARPDLAVVAAGPGRPDGVAWGRGMWWGTAWQPVGERAAPSASCKSGGAGGTCRGGESCVGGRTMLAREQLGKVVRNSWSLGTKRSLAIGAGSPGASSGTAGLEQGGRMAMVPQHWAPCGRLAAVPIPCSRTLPPAAPAPCVALTRPAAPAAKPGSWQLRGHCQEAGRAPAGCELPKIAFLLGAPAGGTAPAWRGAGAPHRDPAERAGSLGTP